MKVSDLFENAFGGATGGAAIAGAPGSLFGGGMVSRVEPKKKKKRKQQAVK